MSTWNLGEVSALGECAGGPHSTRTLLATGPPSPAYSSDSLCALAILAVLAILVILASCVIELIKLSTNIAVALSACSILAINDFPLSIAVSRPPNEASLMPFVRPIKLCNQSATL